MYLESSANHLDRVCDCHSTPIFSYPPHNIDDLQFTMTMTLNCRNESKIDAAFEKFKETASNSAEVVSGITADLKDESAKVRLH